MHTAKIYYMYSQDVVTCDVWETLKMQESIIQYSGTYIWRNKGFWWWVLSRAFTGQRRAFQKEETSKIHQKTGQVPCSVVH